MKLLVTGGTGFIGRHVIDAALADEHEVVAIVRSPEACPAHWEGRVQLVQGDLRAPASWSQALPEVEAVIHLAAATSGSLADQVAQSIVGTEGLLSALRPERLRAFVHVSSFAVYDARARGARMVDEDAPLDLAPHRDTYTEVKRFQEGMVRTFCRQADVPHVVARPGFVFGAELPWNHGLAFRPSRRLGFLFSPGAVFPVTYVENCARVLVAMLQHASREGGVVNIVDPERVTYRRYFRAARRVSAEDVRAIPVPWVVLDGLTMLAVLASRLFFSGKARVPEFLDRRRAAARWRPRRYRSKWEPVLADSFPVSFDEAMRRTFSSQSPPPGELP